MASSSPILQGENQQKNCEELIKNFYNAENLTGKLGFLDSLTYQVFPGISLLDLETEYFVKVIPKVYDTVIESLVKIIDLLQVLGCIDEDESILQNIQSHLKGVITCMECLESCTVHVCQAVTDLSIKQIHSLHPAVLKIILATFTHCKESESIYSEFFQNFSEELSSLFKKTFQLQKVLMELIEKVKLDCNADSEEIQDMTDVCHHLLEICILIGNVDTGLLVNTWKVLNRLVTKHKDAIENELNVEKIVSHLCESIKSKLTQCVTMATINDGQDPADAQFINSAESKSLSKMLKVVRFLIGHLMHVVKEYSEFLTGSLSELYSLLISLHSILPPSLSAPQIMLPVLQEISSSILVVIQPLLKILVTNKTFADLVTKKSSVNSAMYNGFGVSRVLLDIAGILPELQEDVFTWWMKPTNFSEIICVLDVFESATAFHAWQNKEEPCLSLLQVTIESLKKCTVEISLPVYVDGVMCMGKPFRKVSFYEHACTHLCALIASSPLSCFPHIENCLLEYLIGDNLLSVMLSMDLWTFMARWESADLCSNHVHFLIALMNALPKGCMSVSHVSLLISRLACLMAKQHQEQLLTSFPPSKAENVLTWSILPFSDLSDNICLKVCRTAVPVCIKHCHDCLSSKTPTLQSNIQYLSCLRSIYSLDNVHRLVPPVHHSAVLDFINTLWTKFSQQAIKSHEVSHFLKCITDDNRKQNIINWDSMENLLLETLEWLPLSELIENIEEDVWLDIIDLSGLVLPYVQPVDYARILRCLSNLITQSSSVDIKLAVAHFLGKCGTKEVQSDVENGVFGSISGLFSSLVSNDTWIVHQKSLEAVKAFAEVTPYTHIMGDCVPEQLLPSLSDFLNNIPYRQQEISSGNNVWIRELLTSQSKVSEAITDDMKNTTEEVLPAQDEINADNNYLQEPEPKRIKRDDMEAVTTDTKTNESDALYTEVFENMRSHLKTLTDLRTKYKPSQYIVKEFEEVYSTFKTFIEDLKVTK